jgi:sortase (surface protein transpeptidase)
MTFRRILALLLIVAGASLCGIAALHYIRGFQAQTEGRRAFEEKQVARPPSDVRPPSDERLERAPTPAPAELPLPYPLGQPIARLCIPSAKIDAIVFGGSDPDILARGLGHVAGTELPGRRSG